MSGWQRIGVVISVLWLLAVPSYVIISSNQFADAYYKGCLDLAYRTRLNSAEELNAAIQDCSTTRSELAVTPTKALKVYCWRNITVKVCCLGSVIVTHRAFVDHWWNCIGHGTLARAQL